MLEVLDTAGEDCETLRDQWIRDNECFLLVCSIASGEYDRIRRVKGPEYVTSTGDAGAQAYWLIGAEGARKTRYIFQAKWLGCSLSELSWLDSVCLVGFTQELPHLLAHLRLQIQPQVR